MTSDLAKRNAALAAVDQIEAGWVIGVGTGSTANLFIEGLAPISNRIEGAVASSLASVERLESLGIRLLELNEVGRLPIYVDGADEATPRRELIKGGGGALTREKIVAAAGIFGGTVSLFENTLGRFGIETELVDAADSSNFARAIDAKTKMVFIETIGNPRMDVPDIPAVAAVKPHVLFSDNVVLQRDMPVPVWGTADDGEKVTVKFQSRPGTRAGRLFGARMLRTDSRTGVAPPTPPP